MADKALGRFVVDDRGKAVSVLLDMRTYRRMLADLEELADIRAYDVAKASGDETVAFRQALEEIGRKR